MCVSAWYAKGMKIKTHGVSLREQELQKKYDALSANYNRLVADHIKMKESYDEIEDLFHKLSYKNLKDLYNAIPHRFFKDKVINTPIE